VSTLLKLTGISKAFAGVQALKSVSFELQAGEVHALVGENGAGKSTLIKIITGAYQPDAGCLEIAGQPVQENDPGRAHKLGIAAIYQQPALFPDLTVAENIAVGLEEPGGWRRIRWGQRRQRARQLLEQIGAHISPEAEVRRLAMPEQQLVEIARALGARSRMLIMDEPTASLSEREVEQLFRVIQALRSQGVGIIYISHRLEELSQIADRVTVLRDGSVVNKRGTRALAEAAAKHGKPMYVACETLKFDARFDAASWPGPRVGSLFDMTPGPLVTTVVTERGTYAPEIIRTLLAPSRASSAKDRPRES